MTATATAPAGTPAPREVFGASSLTLMLAIRSAGVVIPSAFVAIVAVPASHPHLAADHHDPIALGAEVGLLLAVLFVGGRLVASRLLHPPPSA